MRFVVDMNPSPEWTHLLNPHGHDAVHWLAIGAQDTSDDDIIAWAAQEGRAVFTADLDFAAAIATRGLTAPDVVQLRSGSTDPVEVGHFVAQSIAAAGSKLSGGAILTIDPGHARLRAGPNQASTPDEP